jgi:hypothetical protein
MSHFILTALDLLKVEAAELVREPSMSGVRQLMRIVPVHEILQYIHPLTSIQLSIRRLDEPREVQFFEIGQAILSSTRTLMLFNHATLSLLRICGFDNKQCTHFAYSVYYNSFTQ